MREIEAANRSLVDALSQQESQRDTRLISEERLKLSKAEGNLKEIRARIAQLSPSYKELTSTEVVKIDEVQRLLGASEALVFWYLGEERSFVFSLTRDDFSWKSLPVSRDVTSGKVARFRKGLNVEDAISPSGQPFDLRVAHELYQNLLQPIENAIKEKEHWLLVQTGALTALPMHLLLTNSPSASTASSAFKTAPWLVRRFATSVLPSISGFKALRSKGERSPPGKIMIGFGDPIFGKEESDRSRVASRSGSNPAYSSFWSGAGVDREKLSSALQRLPDTADELNAIADSLNVPRSDIHLRGDATEARVKTLDLANYRIVYFATHGLVAGDVRGVAEPSLVLTLPKQPSGSDDGLLTSSEVTQLKLNADWVVLSACNTIPGDRPGAEALSGLARAFFYAGARALLVSHWPVDSEATTQLTTTAFTLLKNKPELGRAGALRAAMLSFLEAPDATKSHPAFWGPFVVVGEGSSM